MSFVINFIEEENLTVILKGDLDINTVEEFKMKVLEEYYSQKNNVIMDLKELDYIDSTGIGAFMTLYKEVKEAEKTIKIINAKKNISKLFKITELDKLFNMED